MSEVARRPTGWLDLARVLAIGAVVMVHEGGAAVGSRGPGEPATPAWWAANVLDASSRWCVPVFFMVSGALLLDPARTDGVRTFYRRRLARIGVPLVVWTAVYLGFGHVYLDRAAGPADVARAVGSGAPFLQLYFLYVLAGLYLLTPFLRAALGGLPRPAQVAFAAVGLAIGAADQALMTFVGIGEHNAATRFVPYLGYYVAGWVVRDAEPGAGRRRTLTRYALVALPVCLALTVAGAGWAAAGGRGWGARGEYAYSYLAPQVAVLSLAVFWLLREAGTRDGDHWRPGPTTTRLAGLTFGVFAVHAMIFYVLVRDWQVPTGLGRYLATAAWHWLVTIGGAAAVTLALQRIPLLRRLV